MQANSLVRKQGKGTFVAAPTVEYTLSSVFSLSKELETKGLESKFTIVDFAKEKPGNFYQGAFRIPAEEQVVCIIRISQLQTIMEQLQMV